VALQNVVLKLEDEMQKNVNDKIGPCREKQASEKDTILLVKI
jgi:hypothetical protein